MNGEARLERIEKILLWFAERAKGAGNREELGGRVSRVFASGSKAVPQNSTIEIFTHSLDRVRLVALALAPIEQGSAGIAGSANKPQAGPVRAILSFGAGNGKIEKIEFDWGYFERGGVQLCIPCDWIRLEARNYMGDAGAGMPGANGFTPLNPVDARCSAVACLAEGAPTRGTPLTYTVWRNETTNVESLTIKQTVPRFARQVQIQRFPSAPLRIRLADNVQTGTLFTEDILVAAQVKCPLIDLPLTTEVVAWEVTDNAPQGSVLRARIIFNLAL